ncbi:MAG: NUDIX domain-containing protein [Betaproteobacteria bacterium]|nr:NUDIX domain-containing protein [Betaproteobacteria bacterium]
MVPNKILSCGIVPVRYADGDWRLLVLRAYKNWDFPKGVVELDEDPLEAAKRETEEETGITDLDFVFGEDYKETVPYNVTSTGHKVARYYVAETREEDITLPVSPKLNRPEHHEYRWVTCDEAEDLLPPRLAGVLDWVRARVNEDEDNAGANGDAAPEYIPLDPDSGDDDEYKR